MKETWCIKNNKDEIWLQGWGWVSDESADCISIYDAESKKIAKLPKGGEWAICWYE
jgi:hypothetical protein